MKTQIGQLVGANLSEGTLEIEVGKAIIAKAGKYAVVPIEEYERLVKFSLDAVMDSKGAKEHIEPPKSVIFKGW
tara:strand:+ start:639 stop:860 length:222 start_codon:yes stop_codon:yes gene_type:complete